MYTKESVSAQLCKGSAPAGAQMMLQVQPRRAFLPVTDPLSRLPEQYGVWDETACELPKLLAAGQARRVLERMPMLDPRALTTEAEKERALGLLSVFGHAAVHES